MNLKFRLDFQWVPSVYYSLEKGVSGGRRSSPGVAGSLMGILEVFWGHSQGNAYLRLPGIWSKPRADGLDCFAKSLIAISEAEGRQKSQQQLESGSEAVVA